jgi:ribosomal 50S subunit-recycling heat shock protein
MIVVQKGKDRWEIARDSSTKASGDVKAGDKVTVHYTMTAKDIEVKAEKGAKKESASASASPKE